MPSESNPIASLEAHETVAGAISLKSLSSFSWAGMTYVWTNAVRACLPDNPSRKEFAHIANLGSRVQQVQSNVDSIRAIRTHKRQRIATIRQQQQRALAAIIDDAESIIERFPADEPWLDFQNESLVEYERHIINNTARAARGIAVAIKRGNAPAQSEIESIAQRSHHAVSYMVYYAGLKSSMGLSTEILKCVVEHQAMRLKDGNGGKLGYPVPMRVLESLSDQAENLVTQVGSVVLDVDSSERRNCFAFVAVQILMLFSLAFCLPTESMSTNLLLAGIGGIGSSGLTALAYSTVPIQKIAYLLSAAVVTLEAAYLMVSLS